MDPSFRASRKLHKVPGQTRKRSMSRDSKKRNLTSKLQCPKGKIPSETWVCKKIWKYSNA